MRRYPFNWNYYGAAFLICTLLLTACGGGSTLQGIVAGSGPLLNFLVKRGSLTQPKADLLKTDFADVGKCAVDLDNELDRIAKDDPDAKAKKLNAWARSAQWCWKPIVLRQNFAANERTQNIAHIIDGIFAAGVVFFSERGEMRASAEGTKSQVNEQDLNQDLEKRLKELKEAMKP